MHKTLARALAGAAAVVALGAATVTPALAAPAAPSPSPDITCTTDYYLTNDYWGNESYVYPTSPYDAYMSTYLGLTKFCLEGSNSSKEFEQYGTSRCLDIEPTGQGGFIVEEGDCSLSRSHWTLTLYGHVYQIKNNYNGMCMFDGAGTASIDGEVTCDGSTDGQEQFHIA